MLHDPAEIELGATADDGLRYWRAKEAVRNAELRLTAQAASRQAFETRATALLGWIVAVSSLVAAGLSSGLANGPAAKLPAAVILSMEFAAAITCVGVVWPHFWGQPGYEPRIILDSQLGTELEQLESLAFGYADAIEDNETWLANAARLMRSAFCAVAAGPVAGAIALAITLFV